MCRVNEHYHKVLNSDPLKNGKEMSELQPISHYSHYAYKGKSLIRASFFFFFFFVVEKSLVQARHEK